MDPAGYIYIFICLYTHITTVTKEEEAVNLGESMGRHGRGRREEEREMI